MLSCCSKWQNSYEGMGFINDLFGVFFFRKWASVTELCCCSKDLLVTHLFPLLLCCLGSVTFEECFMNHLGLEGIFQCLFGTHRFIGMDKGQAALWSFMAPQAPRGT